MLDLMFKAINKSAWDNFAASSGLVIEDEKGLSFPAPDVLIDEIGPVMTEPAILNERGEVETPAVFNTAFHVNVRIIGTAIACDQLAKGGSGVTWLDPSKVASPSREWAGGMNYWVPEQ